MKIQHPDGRIEESPVKGRTIEEILLKSGVNPLEVLISRGDEIIPEDTIADDTDTIRLIRISHGG